MSPLEEKGFPHSDEAERAVLGSILLANDIIPLIERILGPEDFYREGNRVVYRACLRLAARRAPFDLVTLNEELARAGELDRAGGSASVAMLIDGTAYSGNAEHYARIVKDKAWRRRLIEAGHRIQNAASDGSTSEEIQVLLSGLQAMGADPVDVWVPSTLEGVTSPSACTVPFYAEGLVPQSEVTIIGSNWKTGKTLVAYRLVLDLVTGRPAFGFFPILEAVPVAVFQLEMPHSEDERRIRRLAIGCGIRPEEIPGWARSGLLAVYNRPGLDLRTASGVACFHQVVRASGAKVVLVDSLIAAFAGANLNDNSEMRALFLQAFGPLTAEKVAVVLLHHRRKAQLTHGRGGEDERSALLGAQVFGAAAGRVYTLERLGRGDADAADSRHAFRVKLSLVGSWTPEENPSTVLSIEDTPEGGTLVRNLPEAEQLRQGGVTTEQRVGIALADLVKARGRVPRKEAFALVKVDLDVGERTLAKGLFYARNMGWIRTEKSLEGRTDAVDLLPGANVEEPLE